MDNIKKLISYSSKGITSKVISKDGVNVTLFCMAKGTELSEHTSTKKALVHVIDGKGIFFIGKKKIPMTPGVLIQMDKKTVHALKATSNMSFLLFLF